MELVEILAKELKEWADTTVCYAQDKGGCAYPWTAVPEFSCGRWVSHNGPDAIDHNFKADLVQVGQATDYQTAIVTKEMWEAERAKLKITPQSIIEGANTVINITKEFAPIYCRDRIKEIDSLVESLEEERVSLVQALEDEGFVLISTALISAAPTEDMSNPSNWRKGDYVRCRTGHGSQFTHGNLYTLSDTPDDDITEVEEDDEGDPNGMDTSYFEWHSRPQ